MRVRSLTAEATRRHQQKGCELRFADATTLPFRDEEFDAARVDRPQARALT